MVDKFHNKNIPPSEPGRYWVTNVTKVADQHGKMVFRHSHVGYANWDGLKWSRDDWDQWHGPAEEGER